jgi:RNA polymerase sigma factor (TIGR02999 family)
LLDTDKPALFEAVYQRLKALASRSLSKQRDGTLQTTALVHELYLRIISVERAQFASEGHFYCYAAKAMRHLLLDRVRDRQRLRAGGGWQAVTLGAADAVAVESFEQAHAIEEALKKLEALDPRAAQVTELRYFAGLSVEQIAEHLGLAPRTIDRDWRFAKAFLQSELG